MSHLTLSPFRKQKTRHLPRRPLADPNHHPKAHPRLRLGRLRVRAGHRHRQRGQERLRGRRPRLRPRLHRQQRHLVARLAVRPDPVVLLQGLRRGLSDRPGPGRAGGHPRRWTAQIEGVEEW